MLLVKEFVAPGERGGSTDEEELASAKLPSDDLPWPKPGKSPGVLGVSRPGEQRPGERGDIGDLGRAYREPDKSEKAPPWPLLQDRLPRECRSSWQPRAGITVIMDSEESML